MPLAKSAPAKVKIGRY